jgi:hypothetical protein
MARLKTLTERIANNELPPPAIFKSAEECASAYERGFEGAVYDPEGAEQVESQQFGKGADMMRTFGLEDSGKGKLSLLYPSVWQVAGRDDFFHGSKSQPCGDCVSRSQTHAAMASLAIAVQNGQGSWPDVPDEVYKYGMVFHPSPVYWNRDHGGDGWSCSQAVARSKDSIGLVVCAKYPAPLDFDLTVYSESVAHKWGSKRPPEDIRKQLNEHCTLSYSRISRYEEIRDAIAAGYGITTCGSQGFDSTRDANGVARRKGQWSHAMAYIGVDDTEWARKNYGEPLIAVLNSWGESWISGSRTVQGNSSIPQIPKGSFWAKWSDLSGRDCYAVSAVEGFPRMKLPKWEEALGGLI